MILDEQLIRWVPSSPNQWSPKRNKLSRAVFKQTNGVSVDMLADRRLESGIQDLINRKDPNNERTLAVVSIYARDCIDCGTFPFEDPKPDNQYHAQIWGTRDIVDIASLNQRCLIDHCKYLYFNQALIPSSSSGKRIIS